MTGLGRGRPRRRAAWAARMGLMTTRSMRYLAAMSRSTRPTSASPSSSARAGTGSASSRPVAVQGATSTWGLRRMRLTLPEVASVWISSRPASWTNQTGVSMAAWCWRSGWSRNAISLIVPSSMVFLGLRARLAPGGRRWWRRRSRCFRDLPCRPSDGGEEGRHDGGEAVGLLDEGVVAGALEDLQAAGREGGGDLGVVGPGGLGVVAAHTDQGRDADFPQAGSQVDPADAGLPAGPPRRRPQLVARLDLDRWGQVAVDEGGLGEQLLEPLEPTQVAPPDR